jgi:hypothetical protein
VDTQPKPAVASNEDIAAMFEEVADLLSLQDANEFRVRAYRQAAATLRNLDQPVAEILEAKGHRGLVDLPTIGERLASSIDEIIHTGELHLLRRLRGQVCAEDLFASVPGIGEELAHRVHKGLHIETLEQLEAAAHDGTLEALPGFGPERIKLAREYLASVLGRAVARRASLHGRRPPPVSLLLALDEEYRRLAEANRLHKIAPTRFNVSGRRWLPVWHPEREGWEFTVLFSNSARAHQLGKTRDWVVIYFAHHGDESQCTVVTEFQGSLEGRRVVRGRERECGQYYQRTAKPEQLRAWAHDLAEKLDRQG